MSAETLAPPYNGMVCRAGLAHVYVTAALEHGAVKLKALRIYSTEETAYGGNYTVELDTNETGWATELWIEEHRGCSHDR
jgi:hypothetical protein